MSSTPLALAPECGATPAESKHDGQMYGDLVEKAVRSCCGRIWGFLERGKEC